MRKYKLSELKNLVRCGMAHDLTNTTAEDNEELSELFDELEQAEQ